MDLFPHPIPPILGEDEVGPFLVVPRLLGEANASGKAREAVVVEEVVELVADQQEWEERVPRLLEEVILVVAPVPIPFVLLLLFSLLSLVSHCSSPCGNMEGRRDPPRSGQ